MTSGGHHLLIRAGDEHYLLPVATVVELLPVPPCSPVPLAPDWLIGVCALHGELTAVVDFARFMGIPADAPPSHCLLLDRKVASIALLVSSVEQMVDDPSGGFAAVPIDPLTLISRMESALTSLCPLAAEKGRR